MTTLSGTPVQLTELAGLIIDRVAETLDAPVLVTDERGLVIAASRPDWLRLPIEQVMKDEGDGFMRAPLRANGQAGEILVGRPPDGTVLSPRLVRVLLDLIIDQTTVIERLPKQHELKDDFVYNLLQGGVQDVETLSRHARFLGLDFTPPRAVILIDAAEFIFGDKIAGHSHGDDAGTQRLAQFVIDSVVSFFQLPNDTICGYLGDGTIAVLKASNTRNLAGWTGSKKADDLPNTSWANLAALKRAGEALLNRLRSDTHAAISIGIGRYHPGLDGLAHSYQDAKAALSLGHVFHGQNKVHCLDGLGIAAFVGVSDEQTKLDLAQHLLSPLDHEPEMLSTLEAFFAEDCSPSATAARLSIHRNTLGYRLDKVSSLTGLDPRRFDEAVQIRLALILRSLGGSPDPASWPG